MAAIPPATRSRSTSIIRALKARAPLIPPLTPLPQNKERRAWKSEDVYKRQHAACAPDHEPIQGRQYSDAEYEALNDSLQRRIGHLNCGHTASPIILGVSEPQYTDAQLQKFKDNNAQGITYNGRQYTLYEACLLYTSEREIEY